MASFRRGGQDGEAVRRTHIEDGLEIPDHLEGVTFDQKKRLARLAKMGLGPVAKPQERPRPGHGTLAVSGSTASTQGTGTGGRGLSEAANLGAGDAFNAHQQQQFERRAALLERERRLRKELQRQEEEDQKQQEEKDKRKQDRDKAARGGLKPLGPVQPREEVVTPKPTVGYPSPAPTPSAAAGGSHAASGKMEVKLFASTVERVASSSADATELTTSIDTSQPRQFHEAEDADTESDVEDPVVANLLLARTRAQSGQKAEKRPLADDRKSKRKTKRKRRRLRSDDSSSDAPGSDDEQPTKVSEEQLEDVQDRRLLSDAARHKAAMERKARDGGISWNMMHVESVKGKVSNANKGFTDAELERRFGPREAGPASSLMTEEQVLAMMRKDKKGKSESDWAKRRAQRELAEWTSVKAQRMARTTEEKERLVVSGRGGSKIG